MKNVVYIDFINKVILDKPSLSKPKKVRKTKKSKKVLTKDDIQKMNERVDEIEYLLDMCDSNRDSDIIENLERELVEMIGVLQKPTDEDGLTFIG